MGNWNCRYRRFGIALSLAFFATGCGGVATRTTTPPPTDPTPGLNLSTQPMAVVLGADYDRGASQVGSISLLGMTAPRTAVKNIQTTHSDAIVRVFDNKIYIVNRLGGDNLQVVDPAQNYRVTLQCSVGLGTNPQDIVVVSATKAFISLYQPANNRSSLSVDDIVIVDPSVTDCARFITGAIDLQPYTSSAGDRYPRASSLLAVNGKILVAVQDLPRDLTQAPNVPGTLVEIDPATNRVSRAVTLSGYDPISVDYSEQTGLVYVADSNFFSLTDNFGGIEVVDPATMVSRGVVLSDNDLGGVPVNVKFSHGRLFIATGPVIRAEDRSQYPTKVHMASVVSGNPISPTLLYNGRAYIQDIAVDPTGILLVGDRDPLVNGLVLIDPATRNVVDGPINTGPLPSSIAFINTAAPEVPPETTVPPPSTSTPPPPPPPPPPVPEEPAGGCVETAPPSAQSIYPARIGDFSPGTNAGYGSQDYVFGPPRGLGTFQGSTHVLSLGKNGTITLAFDDYVICDGPGADFTVFENPFQNGEDPSLVYREPASVSVSEDGVIFHDFPCDKTTSPYAGCAGTHPVYANGTSNALNPRDPSVSGGDSYDLNALGLRTARFVRIHDEGLSPNPIGPGKEGFDLDAIAIVHGRTR